MGDLMRCQGVYGMIYGRFVVIWSALNWLSVTQTGRVRYQECNTTASRIPDWSCWNLQFFVVDIVLLLPLTYEACFCHTKTLTNRSNLRALQASYVDFARAFSSRETVALCLEWHQNRSTSKPNSTRPTPIVCAGGVWYATQQTFPCTYSTTLCYLYATFYFLVLLFSNIVFQLHSAQSRPTNWLSPRNMFLDCRRLSCMTPVSPHQSPPFPFASSMLP